MKKIVFAKRNNMNIWLLVLISIVFLPTTGLSFLNYAVGSAEVNYNMLATFTNATMATCFGSFVCGLFSIISLWKSWNKFYAPVWLIMGFVICNMLLVLMVGPFYEIDAILMPISCFLTIAYYLWCQRNY